MSRRLQQGPAKAVGVTLCAQCGAELPKQTRGRPRKFCVLCSPPVSDVGKAESARSWRKTNPDAVEAYNESRRVPVTLDRPEAA